MITIKKPIAQFHEKKARCLCEIDVDSDVRTVWFDIPAEFGTDIFCTDRADAYVVGLLNWAMRVGHDIFCDVPVTEELLYNINTILIPSLYNYSSSLKNIRVIADTVPALLDGKEVGTGCSCGIDSFSAIYQHTNSSYPNMDLTYLVLNNVGAFNECYAAYGIEKVRSERYETTKKVASEIGLPLIETDSNFAEAFPMNHYLTNTYSSCFAIYMLQKFWRIYYLASVGLDYNSFTLKDNDMEDSAHYDLLTLQCFSIPGLKIYSEGGEKKRIDKTRDIIDYKIAQKYLHVCLTKPTNCNVCEKCRRTLVSLDLLNGLEKYNNVFDVDFYKKNRYEYYRWLCTKHFSHDLMNEPVYLGLKERGAINRKIITITLIRAILLKCKKVINRE